MEGPENTHTHTLDEAKLDTHVHMYRLELKS